MKKLLLFTIFLANVLVANANTRMSSYRWRNDDGNETAATWKAAINTPISVNNLNPLRLRIAIDETYMGMTGSTNSNALLEYSENGGAWQSITPSSSAFVLISSTYLADNTLTTQQISSASPTGFSGGLFKSTDINSIYTVPFGSNKFWEHEFCFQPTGFFSPTSTYTFRAVGMNIPNLVTPSIVPNPAATLNFDGVNDNILCGSILPTTYTKEAWVYATNLSLVNNIISGGTDGEHAFWFPSGEGNKLSAGHNGDWTAVQDPTPIVLNTWYHVAVSYDEATTTMKLYKNGTLVSTNTNVPAYVGGNVVRIGAYGPNDNLFSGNIDEVRIWNRVVTEAEIQNNLNCELASGQTGLTAYYKFNQGTNNADNSTETILTDASGNNNNGTLLNFSLTGTASNWIANGGVTSGNICATFLASDSFDSSNFKCYPNPTSDVIHISNTNEITEVIVYNLLGQNVLNKKYNALEVSLDLSQLPANTYLVKVICGEQSNTLKIMKK